MIDFERCWEWPGTRRKKDGRAMAGRAFYAYRAVYEAATGAPCPSGSAHHLCENPGCINPMHLKFVTQGEHLAEHDLAGDNHQADKTHCPQGHPYDEANTYHWNGERHCRICRREAKLRYLARYRATHN